MSLEGVLLPIITPFLNNKVDYKSYKKMIDYYIGKKISGIIPNGTTGECPTLDDYETQELLEKTVEFTAGRLPVYFGLGGNYTDKVVKNLKIVEKYDIRGILSVAPYYNRPDQRGMYEHFKKISENTGKEIIIYNIPYRTGRNIENETLRKLAELKNVTGLKDSCGDIKQSMELLLDPPENFSILTGEDVLFYITLTLGGQGGILAAAHLQTDRFADVYDSVKGNDAGRALETWKKICSFIPCLFEEPNPAPIKYLMKKFGLITSDEVRLPLVDISDRLKGKLDLVELE